MYAKKLTPMQQDILERIALRYPLPFKDVAAIYAGCGSYDLTITVIEEALSAGRSLEDVARACGVTPNHFFTPSPVSRALPENMAWILLAFIALGVLLLFI